MTTPYSDKVAQKLEAIGLFTPADLLLYPPAKYRDYRFPERSIADCVNQDKKYLLKLKLTKKPQTQKTSNKRDMARVEYFDGRVRGSFITFSGVWDLKSKKDGEIIFVLAKVRAGAFGPDLQEVDVISSSEAGKIVAEYKGKEKVISSNQIKKAVSDTIFEKMDEAIEQILKDTHSTEKELIEIAGHGFQSLSQLIMAIHFPKSPEEINAASDSIKRIVSYQAIKQSQASISNSASLKSVIRYDIETIKKVIACIPFDLTKDQKQAIWDISKDLASPFPTDRLISGDVGCGKTMAYAVPAVCAHLAGARVSILSPNGLLATQIYDEMTTTFGSLAKLKLIGQGQTKRKDKEEYNGEIVVGTTAILSWMKRVSSEFSFDLVIMDEQQKLGVGQKKKLTGNDCNIIEATATAIPRTAASVVYGSKKVSFIEECPYDKQIESKIMGANEKRKALDELNQIIKSGSSIAVLYPVRKKDTSPYKIVIGRHDVNNDLFMATMIDCGATHVSSETNEDEITHIFKIKNSEARKTEKKLSEINSAPFSFTELEDGEEVERCKRNVEDSYRHWEKLYPGQVAMIHGGLSAEEKTIALKRAKAGELKVIVVSTVVEIGLTVPGLRGMIVLEAERYGASTLHQIRGRLARNGGYGLFIMMASKSLDSMSEKSMDRLNILVRHTRGSSIAEDDMRQRGFGDLSMGTGKQSGYVSGVFKGVKMTPQDIDYFLNESPQGEQ